MTSFFSNLGMFGNVTVFIVAAAVILFAGSTLERSAKLLGERTKLGEMFAGMVLLALSTSLPDITTSLTATLRGHTDLAVNNLLGGVILQTMVLAVADIVGGKKALTARAPSYGLLLQGVGVIFVLATAIVAASLEQHWSKVTWVSDVAPAMIAVVYGVVQYLIVRNHGNPRWNPAEARGAEQVAPAAEQDTSATPEQESPKLKEQPLHRLLILFGTASAFVCAGGIAVVLATEHIAQATGASEGFLGFTLVAFVTSLPEISTTIMATRRGHHVAAASNIFGSNSLNTATLALVAVVASGATFSGTFMSSIFSASLGIVLTAIYLLGMLERRDQTILRMGWDSAWVLVLGFLGIAAVFALEQ